MYESTKNKIFFGSLILLSVFAIGATYVRVYVNLDYLVMEEVSCDSSSESCFMYSAEELCEGSEDVSCFDNTENEYYKLIYKKAANIPFCEYDPGLGESCPELRCEVDEAEDECFYELCEEDCS